MVGMSFLTIIFFVFWIWVWMGWSEDDEEIGDWERLLDDDMVLGFRWFWVSCCVQAIIMARTKSVFEGVGC